jgi:hypothetical protein
VRLHGARFRWPGDTLVVSSVDRLADQPRRRELEHRLGPACFLPARVATLLTGRTLKSARHRHLQTLKEDVEREVERLAPDV